MAHRGNAGYGASVDVGRLARSAVDSVRDEVGQQLHNVVVLAGVDVTLKSRYSG